MLIFTFTNLLIFIFPRFSYSHCLCCSYSSRMHCWSDLNIYESPLFLSWTILNYLHFQLNFEFCLLGLLVLCWHLLNFHWIFLSILVWLWVNRLMIYHFFHSFYCFCATNQTNKLGCLFLCYFYHLICV